MPIASTKSTFVDMGELAQALIAPKANAPTDQRPGDDADHAAKRSRWLVQASVPIAAPIAAPATKPGHARRMQQHHRAEKAGVERDVGHVQREEP